jgi:uncharacterized membrane protein
MSMRPLAAQPINPVLLKHAEMRARSVQNRVADAITRFAGSMVFVYVHVVWFSLWIGFRVEKFPFGLLTMIVSLEAIFLATFLLISGNRQDERRQMLADHQWQLVQEQEKENVLEVQQNKELLALSQQILDLTRQIHALTTGGTGGQSAAPDPA